MAKILITLVLDTRVAAWGTVGHVAYTVPTTRRVVDGLTAKFSKLRPEGRWQLKGKTRKNPDGKVLFLSGPGLPAGRGTVELYVNGTLVIKNLLPKEDVTLEL